MSSSGRVACPQCGANNFDTVTVCWKCNAPLRGAAASYPVNGPALQNPSRMTSPPPAAPGTGSQAAGERAALWLGLLFPYFGLPVGLVFMMLDDERKQHLGRICILWSCISMVVHVAFMAVAALGLREMLFAALQGVRGAATRGSGIEGL